MSDTSRSTETNRVVYKFPLHSGVGDLRVPFGGIVRHVGQQQELPTLWIEVDPSQRLETWTIEALGTGHPFITDRHFFLGTVLVADGALVWHIYRRVDP